VGPQLSTTKSLSGATTHAEKPHPSIGDTLNLTPGHCHRLRRSKKCLWTSETTTYPQMRVIRLEKDAKERRKGYWATTYIQYLVPYLNPQAIVDQPIHARRARPLGAVEIQRRREPSQRTRLVSSLRIGIQRHSVLHFGSCLSLACLPV